MKFILISKYILLNLLIDSLLSNLFESMKSYSPKCFCQICTDSHETVKAYSICSDCENTLDRFNKSYVNSGLYVRDTLPKCEFCDFCGGSFRYSLVTVVRMCSHFFNRFCEKNHTYLLVYHLNEQREIQKEINEFTNKLQTNSDNIEHNSQDYVNYLENCIQDAQKKLAEINENHNKYLLWRLLHFN
jgi:hypothetical protein